MTRKLTPKHLDHLYDNLMSQGTCRKLQRLAKSLGMRGFTRKRKSDLASDISNHISGHEGIAQGTLPLGENLFDLRAGILKEGRSAAWINRPNADLSNVNDEDYIKYLVAALFKYTEEVSKIWTTRHKSCEKLDPDRLPVFGRSENGCKPGYILQKLESSGCWRCVVDGSTKQVTVLKRPAEKDLVSGDTDEPGYSLEKFESETRAISADIGKAASEMTSGAFSWFLEFCQNMQKRVFELLVDGWNMILDFFLAEECTDEKFMKEVEKAMREPTWSEWAMAKLKKGVNVLGYVLSLIYKAAKAMLRGSMSVLRKIIPGAWNMAKTLAGAIAYSPTQFRLITLVTKRTMHQICGQVTEFVADHIEAQAPGYFKDLRPKPDEGMLQASLRFLSDTGVFSPAKMGKNIIAAVNQNPGSVATMVGMGLAPFTGGLSTVAPAAASMVLTTVSTSLVDAVGMELEAQVFREDVSAGFSNLLSMVNPAECMAQSPRIVFVFKTKFEIDVTKWTKEGREEARKRAEITDPVTDTPPEQ